MKQRLPETSHMWLILLWLFAAAWIVLMLSQGLFAWLNRDLFSIAPKERWLLVVGNMKFAASAVAFFLWPSVVTALIVSLIKRGMVWLRIVYGISMGLMLAANVIDTSYYRWTFRRMTWDIFSYTSSNFEGEWGTLLLQFLHDFWPYFLLYFALMTLILWVAQLLRYKAIPFSPRWGWKVVAGLLTVVVLITLQRGGFINQHKPLRVVDASRYASGNNTALVLNSPFSIIRSKGHTGHLQPLTFFDDEAQMEQYFTPKHIPAVLDSIVSIGTPSNTGSFITIGNHNRPNVVLIILESVGEEYVGYLNQGRGPSYAPFLDSLCRQATVVKGMANGKRSIESVPSLLSGIPSLMEEAYITSPYAQNSVVALPQILQQAGYRTSFFHGAYNGSMNFDSYVRGIGIESYYGMDQYNDKQTNPQGVSEGDFDGTWGIFDEPFLQFAARTLNTMPSAPFFATLYTISSHHPYTIPPQYQGRFAQGPQPIIEVVGYADMALKQFFATVSTMSWYENTLFIITADHASQPVNDYYKGGAGQYAVPMIFYWPNHTLWLPHASVNSQGTGLTSSMLMQHADLYPTLIDLLSLPDTCYAFGHSIFDPQGTFHIAYLGNSTYQLTQSQESVTFNATQGDIPPLAQALLQQYTHRLIENKLR